MDFKACVQTLLRWHIGRVGFQPKEPPSWLRRHVEYPKSSHIGKIEKTPHTFYKMDAILLLLPIDFEDGTSCYLIVRKLVIHTNKVHLPIWYIPNLKCRPFLDSCVSSLCMDYANLLCIVPILHVAIIFDTIYFIDRVYEKPTY